MQTDCVFCRIVVGDLPACKVHEDAEVLAFMDIHPVVKGHTLVVPKMHCDPITHVPADLLQKVILVVQNIARAQIRGLAADGLNVTQANGEVAGQVVPHTHFHVIPRFEKDARVHHWTPGEYDSREEMEQWASKIRAALDPKS